jgi:hypothetical protein
LAATIPADRSQTEAFKMQSALWRKWIVAVAVAFADLSVTPVDELFTALILANFSRNLDGFGLSWNFRRQAGIAFSTDTPSILSWNYVLVLAHRISPPF